MSDTNADSAPLRYAVLVWMHDHWGVTFQSNIFGEAEDARAQAIKKVPTVFIDTSIPLEMQNDRSEGEDG